MKNNEISKLSPLEELRQRKSVLQKECKVEEEKIFELVENVRNSWKGLLVSSIFSSSKSVVSSLFSTPKRNRDRSDVSTGVMQKVLPLAIGILQPILMKMLMNKIKNLFVKTKK